MVKGNGATARRPFVQELRSRALLCLEQDKPRDSFGENVAFEMNDIRPSAAMSRTSNLRYDPVQAFITISGVQPRIPTMKSPLNHMHQKMTLGPPYTAK